MKNTHILKPVSDQFLEEIWSIKDAIGAEYTTLDNYVAYLREQQNSRVISQKSVQKKRDEVLTMNEAYL